MSAATTKLVWSSNYTVKYKSTPVHNLGELDYKIRCYYSKNVVAPVYLQWSSQIKQWNLDEEQSEMLGDQLREIENTISPLKMDLFLVKHNLIRTNSTY